MAIYDSVFIITFEWELNGVLGETTLPYTYPTTQPTMVSFHGADAAFTELWPNIRLALSESTRLLSIKSELFQKPPVYSKPPYVYSVGLYGNVAGDTLPPYATMVINKIPDNTTKTGGGNDFKGGRLGLMGVPESFQSNGLLNSTGQAALNVVADTLLTLPVTSPDDGLIDYQLMMYRLNVPAGTGSTNALVSSLYGVQRLGTQNSRKYS